MRILALRATPRKRGNSLILLETFLDCAPSGAEVELVNLYGVDIKPCVACGACASSHCVIEDDMGKLYPLLEEADVLVVSTPIYFYGPPAPLKAFMDRCQPWWYRHPPVSKRGVLMAVGASGGENLFLPIRLMAKVWMRTLGASLEVELLFRGLEHEGEVLERPEILEEVRLRAGKFFEEQAD